MFDPAFPPTSNSLNRFKIWELADFPKEKLGRGGYRLISSAALTDAIQVRLAELAIDSNLSEKELQQTYFELLEVGNLAAIQIAKELGANLGSILLALHDSTQTNREGNSEKDIAYWDYWSNVQTIYLGGGLASGKIGAIIAREAQLTVSKHLSDYKIAVAQNPRHLCILGAARYVSAGNQAIIFDFGGTFVKRARAFYSENKLQCVQLLESVPSGFGLQADETESQAIFERFVDVLVDGYQEGDAPFIPVSIAAYVSAKGQPYLAQGGIYMLMSHLGNNVPQLLSRAVSEHLGKPIIVKLIHDGTAAASFFSPLENAAVIMIGTAIGSGYPVARPDLRDVASDLRVR